MKKHLFITTLFIFLLTCLTGCQAIAAIFKTGMGVGVFLVVIVIAIVIYIFSRMGKKE